MKKPAKNNRRCCFGARGGSLYRGFVPTVLHGARNTFAGMNAVYGTFFTEGRYPARSAVEVARVPKDALVEIEVIAQL